MLNIDKSSSQNQSDHDTNEITSIIILIHNEYFFSFT